MSYLFGPAGPVLTPVTAQRLIDTFSNPFPSELYSDPTSSSSQSPDSLYSECSSIVPNVDPFEFDATDHDHQAIDTGDYEALMSNEDVDGDESLPPSSPAWGRWPQQSNLGGSGWTPLPTHGGLRSASIISISPRGSINNSRRGSAPVPKLSDPCLRRTSAGNILAIAEGRRSSAKSQMSSRRRSSVMSNGSTFDPVEDERLRRLCQLDVLARRFSELVEVVSPCPGADEGLDDVARVREMISRWSPYSTDTDVSEVRTMSFAPTPQVERAVPALLSNYPLATVAREYSLNTPEDMPMPTFSRAEAQLPIEYTPPPPVEPIDQLRQRVRPGVIRALTDFTFPSRSVFAGMLDQAAEIPRPAPRRAVSSPHPVPAAIPICPDKTEARNTVPRDVSVLLKSATPTGSFPLARSVPLGLSRLRESTRRASVSPGVPQSRRPSIVAERRMSIVEQGSSRTLTPRRVSQDVSPKSSRKPSLDPPHRMLTIRRKSSSVSDLHKAALDAPRKASNASRASSIVSLGEYRYLANEIDNPVPQLPPLPAIKSESLRSRRNAPPTIELPAFSFPAVPPGPASVSPTSATPRYNPLDMFFGRTAPALSPSTGLLLSPDSEGSTPKTPGLHRSVLDRGRPIASPEFEDSFPLRSSYPSQGPKYQHSAHGSYPQFQAPLKSILVKHTDGSPSIPIRPGLPLDIQAASPAGRTPDTRPVSASGMKVSRPPIKRPASFTRLFHRAKGQSSPTS